MKTFGGDSFFKMLKQIELSSTFTMGVTGEYTEEFDINTRELKFTGSSQFAILMRGTHVAFLERYSSDMASMGVNA